MRRRTAVVWKTGNEGSSAAAYIHHTVLSVILTPPTVVYIDSCWQQGWGYNRRSEHSITTEDKHGKLYEHEQSKKGDGAQCFQMVVKVAVQSKW